MEDNITGVSFHYGFGDNAINYKTHPSVFKTPSTDNPHHDELFDRCFKEHINSLINMEPVPDKMEFNDNLGLIQETDSEDSDVEDNMGYNISMSTTDQEEPEEIPETDSDELEDYYYDNLFPHLTCTGKIISAPVTKDKIDCNDDRVNGPLMNTNIENFLYKFMELGDICGKDIIDCHFCEDIYETRDHKGRFTETFIFNHVDEFCSCVYDNNFYKFRSDESLSSLISENIKDVNRKMNKILGKPLLYRHFRIRYRYHEASIPWPCNCIVCRSCRATNDCNICTVDNNLIDKRNRLFIEDLLTADQIDSILIQKYKNWPENISELERIQIEIQDEVVEFYL